MRAVTHECRQDGCLKRTREGKPYCPDHVYLNPYVASLLADMERIEVEKQARKAVATGHVAHEIMVVLWSNNGVASVELIARTAGLERGLVVRTLRAMVSEKRVILKRTNRGRTMAKSKEQDPMRRRRG